MPKNPTKAAGNVFCEARMTAKTWNDKLASREGAAEVLSIDRTRLARIELGSLSPYPEEVLLMADGYNAPELLNCYCCDVCPIGCRNQQKLELADLDRLTVKILSACRKSDTVKDSLLEITEDGLIDETERPELAEVIAYFKTLGKAADELELWAQKNL